MNGAVAGAGRLTTHVLDASRGRPGAGIPLALTRMQDGAVLCRATTNADGRCDQPLLQGADFLAGRYELMFSVGAYLERHHGPQPVPPYLDEVVLRFGVAASDQHYHVALLVSPHSYTTYRGS